MWKPLSACETPKCKHPAMCGLTEASTFRRAAMPRLFLRNPSMHLCTLFGVINARLSWILNSNPSMLGGLTLLAPTAIALPSFESPTQSMPPYLHYLHPAVHSGAQFLSFLYR